MPNTESTPEFDFETGARRHKIFMRAALCMARKAARWGDVPVGALVVKAGRIVAAAANEREKGGDPTAHAEMLALRRAARRLGTRRLEGCLLYVTLEPCAMCAGAIAAARPDAVIYGAFDPTAGCAGSVYELCGDPALGNGVPIVGGVLEGECAALLSEFFKEKRNEGTT